MIQISITFPFLSFLFYYPDEDHKEKIRYDSFKYN